MARKLPVSEDEVQATIMAAMRFHGFKVVHFRPARTERGWRTPLTGDAGFPDVIGALDGDAFAIEVKGDNGRLAAAQREWGEELGGAAGGVIRWRLATPASLDAVLAEIRDSAEGRHQF